MLRLPPFELCVPSRLEEALELLAEGGEGVTVSSGGTDLFPGMKRGLSRPRKLVSLGGIQALETVTWQPDGGVHLGARVTLSQLAMDETIRERLPALSAAAALVATPQIRNRGTVGGNLLLDTRCPYYNQSEGWRQALGHCLKKEGSVCWVALGSDRCWAISSSDLAPVLIALDATLKLASASGNRSISCEDLYRPDGINFHQKRQDEILTDISVPERIGFRMTYRKLRRRGSFDFPSLGVAVCMRLDDSGTCQSLRVVLGAVSMSPVRVREAERILVGRIPDTEMVEQVAEAAFQSVTPMENADLRASYRKQMVRVYVRRALAELLEFDTEVRRDL